MSPCVTQISGTPSFAEVRYRLCRYFAQQFYALAVQVAFPASGQI